MNKQQHGVRLLSLAIALMYKKGKYKTIYLSTNTSAKFKIWLHKKLMVNLSNVHIFFIKLKTCN